MIATIVCILSGLALGSFLNVCITRLPLGESVVSPRSHCRRCGRQLSAAENVPLLSWLLLGGRCKSCKAAIGWRYPAVEILTCLFFGACYWTFGWRWETAAWAALCFLLLGLAVMDGETLLLPDWFTLPGLALGLAFAGLRAAGSGGVKRGLLAAGIALASALIAAAVLLLISLIYWLLRRRQGMGMGDVKLIAMLAAWLGLPRTALVFVVAVVAGALYGLSLLLFLGLFRSTAEEGRDDSRQPRNSPLAIPFGAFLSVAGLYSIFLGERTLGWYAQFFR